jgi:hypothetical protein
MLNQEYQGACQCSLDRPSESGSGSLLVAIPCRIEGIPDIQYALLDTAAEWCVLPGEIALKLGLDTTSGPDSVRYETRFGRLSGKLERRTLTLIAQEGQDVEVDATFFVCSDWHDAVVVGWKGCLVRIRFALGPSTETCYFAPI